MKIIKFRKNWNLKEGDQIAELCPDRITIKRVCGKTGIWDYDGKNIIPDQKQKIKSITVEEDTNRIKKIFIIQKTNGKIHFYDHDGNEFECGEIDTFEVHRKTCIVGKDGQKGVISLKTGKTIIPIKFEKVENMYHREHTSKYGEIYKVYKNGKCGCYFENDELILPVEFDDWNWREGEESFDVTDNNLHGVYDFTGKQIVPVRFLPEITSEVKVLEKNKCMKIYIVKSEKGKGVYFDYSQKFVEPQFDEVKFDSDYGLIVRKDELYGLYSFDGENILEVQYEKIVNENIYNISERKWGKYLKLKGANGLYGFYHSNKLYEPQFEKISMLYDSITDLYVVKNGFCGIYSSVGEMIVEPECSEIKKVTIKDSDKTAKVYYFKKVDAYGFYFYEDKFKKLIKAQFTKFEARINENDGKMQIIAENDGTTVIIDENGTVNNSHTEVV